MRDYSKDLKVFIILIISILLSYQDLQAQNEQYSFILRASLKGYADSTRFMLQYSDPDNNKEYLTAYITNHVIEFKGKMTRNSGYFLLRTFNIDKNFESINIWLENKEMVLEGEMGKLANATLIGSSTNDIAKNLPRTENPVDEKYIKDLHSFIQQNNESVVAAYIIDVYKKTWGKTITLELYNLLSVPIKQSAYGESISKYLSVNADIKVGSMLVDLSLPDTLGIVRKVTDINGKYVLIEFWGSWCGPCRKENPELVRIYNEFKNKGFEIYAIGIENSRKRWIEAIRKDQLPWVNVSDLKGSESEATDIYGVYEYPSNFLINPNGIVIARNLRGKALQEELARHLNK